MPKLWGDKVLRKGHVWTYVPLRQERRRKMGEGDSLQYKLDSKCYQWISAASSLSNWRPRGSAHASGKSLMSINGINPRTSHTVRVAVIGCSSCSSNNMNVNNTTSESNSRKVINFASSSNINRGHPLRISVTAFRCNCFHS